MTNSVVATTTDQGEPQRFNRTVGLSPELPNVAAFGNRFRQNDSHLSVGAKHKS